MREYSIARFTGSGLDSINSIASDSAGNIYIAGTASSLDLPIKNATQPLIGEAPIMRSTDGGVTWLRLNNPPPPVIRFAPHPVDPQVLFALAGNGIHKSSDGGRTWRYVHDWKWKAAQYDQMDIAIDTANPDLMYVAAPNFAPAGLFLASADGGENWQTRPSARSGLGVTSRKLLSVAADGSGSVLFGSLISRDRGLTWTSLRLPAHDFLHAAELDPHHTGWIYISVSSKSNSLVYLSQDWGATWSAKMLPGTGAVRILLLDPAQAGRLYATVGHLIYVSNDNASTWNGPLYAEPSQNGFGELILTGANCPGGGLWAISGERGASGIGQNQEPRPFSLQGALSLSPGPGCAVYAARTWTSDAFAAKLSPSGELIWSTFLGGAGTDSSVSIALTPDGRVFVGGRTASPDFPVTVASVGPSGGQKSFVVALDPDGTRRWSTVIGGETRDELTTLSVHPSAGVYLAGTTSSQSFPLTPGAYRTQPNRWNNGFAVRLTPEGRLVYATYLPYELTDSFVQTSNPSVGHPRTPLAIAAEPDGAALVGGNGPTLSRLSADGSTMTPVRRLPGQVHLIESDKQGDFYVAGQFASRPTVSRACVVDFGRGLTRNVPAADIYVTKLQADGLDEIHTTRMGGPCRAQPTALRVNGAGEALLGVWALRGFSLRNPLLATAMPGAIARLAQDGSGPVFSTYVPASEYVGAAAVAPGLGDAVIYGLTTYEPGEARHLTVAQLPAPSPPPLTVTATSETLTGSLERVNPGSLLTIHGTGLSAAFVDLGLNHPGPLPRSLGGVQVLFDGAPVEIFQVTPDYLICLVPSSLREWGWVSVQVVSETGRGIPFLIRVNFRSPALLTSSFPLPPPTTADGEIRNEDGTRNGVDNPAKPGSTVTLFATGLPGPGRVALYWAPRPPYPNLEYSPAPSGPGPVYGQAEAMPGFIGILHAIKLKVPDALGPGVDYLPPPGVVTPVEIRMFNTIGIYVK